MTVDNGKKCRLEIAGLFDGECGESGGRIAFIPNLRRKRASEARFGVLDGEVVQLRLVTAPGSGNPFAVFTYGSAE